MNTSMLKRSDLVYYTAVVLISAAIHSRCSAPTIAGAILPLLMRFADYPWLLLLVTIPLVSVATAVVVFTNPAVIILNAIFCARLWWGYLRRDQELEPPTL